MITIQDVWSNIITLFTGKAISHRPDLSGRVHIASGPLDRESVSLEDYSDFVSVYEMYVWVHKAVQKTAEQIAPKKVRVVDIDGEEIEGHPLTSLLEYYNDSNDTIEDGWQAYITDMLLAGEAAFELVENSRGEPVEMWHRRPDKLHVLPDKERLMYPIPAGYTYGDDDGLILPQNIWHNKFTNPLNPWRGLAPIKAVREGITIDLFAQAWHKKFLKDGARPDFAIIAPEGLTMTEKQDYEDMVISRHSGVEGWHRPMVLEKGIVDIKPFSFPPKDIEWLSQREFSRDEVGALFGMPDEIMGYGRDTYENFETAWSVWWTLTLKPMIDHRDKSLQSFFTKVRPLLSPGQFVETDLNDVGALQEDLSPKIDMAEKLFVMGVPFNIIDERLGLGIGEIPNGENPFGKGETPEQLMPFFPQDNQPQDSRPPETVQNSAKKKTISERNQALTDWQQLAEKVTAKGNQLNKVYIDDRIPLADSYKIAAIIGLCHKPEAVREVFSHLDEYIKAPLEDRDELDPTRVDLEDEFTPEIEQFLQEQVNRIINTVRLESSSPTGAFWTNENKMLLSLLVPFVGKWTDASISQQAVLLGNVGLGIDANINARASEWAGKYALDLAKGLNATTKELARVKIRNWIASGQPLDALVNDLGEIISPRWRAELIASTEVTRAYAEVVDQIAGELDVVKKVVWQTAQDERVCPICGPLQGATKSKGGTFKGDFDRPPAHPRCRCWLVLDV